VPEPCLWGQYSLEERAGLVAYPGLVARATGLAADSEDAIRAYKAVVTDNH